MITDQGFIRPSLDEIEADIQAQFTAKFEDGGENNPSLGPEDFLGASASILAEIKNQMYIIAERNFFDSFLTTARGVALDRLAAPTTRIDALKAVSNVDLTGPESLVVPIGTIFEKEDDVQYESLVEVTITGGVANVEVAAVIAGVEGNAPVGAIRFVPFFTDLDSVTNPVPAQDGGPIETDSNYRARAISDRTADRTSSLIAIINRVVEVEGVVLVRGFENRDFVPVDDRHPTSYEIAVRGGTDFDIGTAIYRSGAAGIQTEGTESVIIVGANGQPFEVNFSRIVEVGIAAEVTLTINTDPNNGPVYVPAVGDQLVKQAILDYIGGVNPSAVESPGVEISEDLRTWKANASLFDPDTGPVTPGILDVNVLMSRKPAPPTLEEIIIDDIEEPFIDFADIDIVLV